MDIIGSLNGAHVWWAVGATSHVDAFVDQVKQARVDTPPPGRVLVISAGVEIDSASDYDSVGALAAAVIRLRVDQWLGVGQQAKALSTQVGLEGSWDGESLWSDGAPGAYDYVRVWPKPGDLIVLAGVDSQDIRALRGLIEGAVQ